MRVYVIGGGAAGLIAAICARRSGFDVTILEKNEKTGKKLYITGKGRCNLTNASSIQNLIDNTVRNGKFLYGAYNAFDSARCMDFFEKLGVPLKIERGNRVFPVSDRSSDVINALNREIKRSGIELHLNEKVVSIKKKGEKVHSIRTKLTQYDDVGYLIIATGGITYPSTGSTGDGYTFAESVGHTLTSPIPSLCDIVLNDDMTGIQGLALKNVSCRIEKDDKTLYEEFGEMLFTDKGVGGPCVLRLSARICRSNLAGMKFVIDLKPALTEETLGNRLLRELGEQKNKAVKNVLPALMPKNLVPVVLFKSGLSAEKTCNAVTKEERTRLHKTIKKLSFDIKECEKERAVITSGGIPVGEISPKTMRSKLCVNLAFAGEIIDVDAMTGGYNLQIAFSTGYLAGTNAEIQ